MRASTCTALVLLLGCCCGERASDRSPDLPAERTAEPVAVASGPAEEIFVDRAAELGVDFVHFNGMTGELYYAEMMGSGAALLDHDGDGDLDLYLVQGARLGSGRPLFPPPSAAPSTDRLYRNDAGSGDEAWRFVDVTAMAGGVAAGYGMGVAAGDYDGDGWTDLYVTRLGPNVLLHNRGDGGFEDRSATSGTADPGWGVPAVFFDYDRDGRLDLYVGNYVEWAPEADRACFGPTGARDYCGPTAYPGARDRLYRNVGGGRFADVSRESGVGLPAGRTLGAQAADLDGDGRPDLYVANDGEPNFLWLNRHGRFVDRGLASGCAVDAEGRPQASMGVDAADYDGDGDDDLFLTHLSGEPNTLYRGDGRGLFEDVSLASGLAAPSLPLTGFGAAWLDFDNDGRLDLLTVNGAVRLLEPLASAGDPHPLGQRRQLFHNRGDGRFVELSRRAGAVFEVREVGRGAAFGDLDNDGDTDVVVANNNGPARVLVNRLGAGASWIGVRPSGGELRLGVRADGAAPRSRRSRRDGSYASAHDPRVIVGLGEVGGPVEVELRGREETVVVWTGLRPNRYYVAPPPPAGAAPGRGR